MTELAEVGEQALRFEIEPGVDRAALIMLLRALPRVTDACVTEGHALVVHDGDPPDVNAALASLRGRPPHVRSAGREHSIDVALDGEDVRVIVERAGLGSVADLGSVLEANVLDVSFLGFCPGFAYLRGLDPRLAALERRASPRPRVPAGSLAIAGGFAGIYPFATPGGWNLVGRTLVSPFEGEHARFSPGDRLRLRVVDGAPQPAPEHAAPRAGSLVVRSGGPAFVQDLGRRGRLAEGVPRGGALVPAALVHTNRLAGNADDAAAIERFGPLTLTSSTPALVTTDDGEIFALEAGGVAELGWARGRRVGYVAVRGGLDVPRVLGGHGTHVSVGIGGYEGRSLRKGDSLAVGRSKTDATRSSLQRRPDDVVRLVTGPDAEPHALAQLLASEWRISHTSDRTGVRLEGPVLVATERPLRTVPMIDGVIELPPSGQPIVLGPDHPTTGGYPAVATVVRADLGELFARAPGTGVRFLAVSAEDARAALR